MITISVSSGRAKISALVSRADRALDQGDLETFISTYRELGVSPPVTQLLRYGEKSFLEGNLDDGLFAYTLVGERPDSYYLDECAKTASAAGNPQTAQRAQYLATILQSEEECAELAEQSVSFRYWIGRLFGRR